MINAASTAIPTVLREYAAALKASDVAAVVRLFTDDGVLLPQAGPTAVGVTAVSQAYAEIFRAIHLDIQFHVAEVVELTSEWAFARTTSTGTITLHATGQTIPEANQELFIFQKVSGDWRVARYAYSVVNPNPPS